ncbi:zf-HC2 domain-containing protein, partial [Streptomyces sp. NPDC004362]|uniref:anti-sigma factor family protein n=1 Tax=Streptomyces sp. NPDC004362 TaxID=3154456 RepID=UPI0033A78BF7
MSGSRRPTPAEQHLGDRLSALIDGELGHDTRERVLAHLATCAKCKAEADAQRRLKNVFAEAAPPPPSESFLARLHGLPAGGDVDGGGTPLGGGGFGRRLPTATGMPTAPGVFGVTPEPFAYVPAGPHATALSPSDDSALSSE